MHMPKHGVGLKVAPTVWYPKKTYYEITKVSPPTTTLGRVYGKRSIGGRKRQKQVLLPTYNFKSWHFYKSELEMNCLNAKIKQV